MTAVYKFIVKGEVSALKTEDVPPTVVFEELAEATITWDKNGLRIEKLPDFTSKPWWNVIEEKLKSESTKTPGNRRELTISLKDLASVLGYGPIVM